VTDIYQPYRDMLAGREVPIHADRPYPGRYKMKRNGAFVPVAIGPDSDGNILAQVDGKMMDAEAVWTHCAKHPVPQNAYKFRLANGHWPDEPKPSIGHNMPSDPFEALLAEIADKSEQANSLLNQHPEIKAQQTCDLFRNMQAQLLALHKRADTLHEEQKRPVLDQGRAIDERFRFRGAIRVLTERLRSRFETFLKVEERRQQEAARQKYEAERAAAEAERKRIEVERAKLMENDPIQALTTPAPELPELPLAPEPVKVQAGGGFGRKAGLKSVWVPVLTDFDAAVKHYADNAKLRELVQKLADADVRTGKRTIPGFDVKEDRRAA
jgi:hypothetical protein